MLKRATNQAHLPENGFRRQGYKDNERPYNLMVEWLTADKSDEDCKKIIQEFMESHTYLLISEAGRLSPPFSVLKQMYQGEKENGIVGFGRAILDYDPGFFD